MIEALCYVAIIQFVFPNLVAAVKQGAMFATIAYQLVGAACLLLLWPSGRALIAALRAQPAAAATATPQVHAHHDHAHHDHSRHDHDAHDHDDHAHHDHGEASAWGHAHAPEPQELAGPGGWTRGFSAVVAVGLRPCSGAIIVLVFALAQGLFWAGVAATFVMGLGTAMTVAVIATIAVAARSWAGQLAGAQSGYGMLAMRAIEVAAALVIVAFGALLLTGYMVSERIGV